MSAEMTAHGASAVSSVLFGWDPMIVASTILGIIYMFIIFDRIHATIVAMCGAVIMILLGILNQDLAVQGIDFNTIFLLVGMMVIVGITKKTGVFQFVAIWTAKLVRGNPRSLLWALSLITAVFSALLDNVTTVMLIVPVTLLLTDQLKLNPYPFLFSQIFASNIGGAATLIGDPPNILIGSAVGFSFMDFVYNMAPVVCVILVAIIIFFDLFWGRKFDVPLRLRARLVNYQPNEALTDIGLLYRSLFVILLVLFGFVYGHHHGIMPGTTALGGAALLMLLEVIGKPSSKQSHLVHQAFSGVEWDTIFFFIGLFILVYGVEQSGALSVVGHAMIQMTEGDVNLTTLVVLWGSAIASAVVNNIPFIATMIPLIHSMQTDLGGPEALTPIWWALALGACLGGNGSLVGASANVMVASFAERAGERISFMKFFKLGFPLMIATIAIAHVYVEYVYLR